MPQQSIDKVFSTSPNANLGNIYVGNLHSATNIHTLNNNHIAAVVTVAHGFKLQHSPLQLPDYLYIPAYDRVNFDMTTYFSQTSAFIGKCLGTTNVLVHCAAGVSRSATVVIAFLMGFSEKGSKEILKDIKSKRPEISPNPGFMLQLKFYESLLREERMNRLIRKKLQEVRISSKRVLTEETKMSNLSFLSETRVESVRCPSHEPRDTQKSSQNLAIVEIKEKGTKQQKGMDKSEGVREWSKNEVEGQEPRVIPLRVSSCGKLTNRKNLKLSSHKRCFQKMVLNNEKRIHQRLYNPIPLQFP